MKSDTILICNNVTKSFNKKCVINNFNFSFKSKGLYTIYGESGSGKTTLLNILYKNLDIDSGNIELYGKNISKIKKSELQGYVAYISQNNYFVDYLNVYDNLSLCTEKGKSNKIEYYLKYFNLLEKKNSFPCELSGGEKERIAIISAILQEKKIIFLDEPTASLDKDTRKLLLNLLSKLKNECLIICATHDETLLKISDETINIKQKNDKNSQGATTNASQIKLKNNKRKNKNLLKYMLKQFSFKYGEKISPIILIIIFTISMLIFNTCFDYEKKIEQSLLKYYNINYVNYLCDLKNKDYCDHITKQYNSIKNIYLYSENVPLGKYNADLDYYEPVDYNLTAKTLPYDKELLLNAASLIKCGNYFETEKDILIGSELAKSLSDNPEDLINSEYEIKLFTFKQC